MASEPSQSSDLVVYNGDQQDEIKDYTMDMDMAHVSVQAQGIAASQRQLHVNQQILAQQQQLYTEARVQQARAEAASRTNVLVDMIRETRIDPVALEQHVNSKLESAISVANDMAHAQARAVAEAHAAQHAQDSGARFMEAFKELECQLHASLDQRLRELLTAHMEQVGAEVRLAIATQGREMTKLVEKQFEEFQNQIAAQIEQVKSCAARKAKIAVRRHHAEESRGHDAITASLLHEIAECKSSAVACAAQRAEEILQTFINKQDAVLPVWTGQISDIPADQRSLNTGSVPAIKAVVEECSTLSYEGISSGLTG